MAINLVWVIITIYKEGCIASLESYGKALEKVFAFILVSLTFSKDDVVTGGDPVVNGIYEDQSRSWKRVQGGTAARVLHTAPKTPRI